MQQLQEVVATLWPHRTDDLRPGVSKMIGRTGTWYAAWIVEHGPYKGEWAMAPKGVEFAGECAKAGFAWVPESDLEEVTA